MAAQIATSGSAYSCFRLASGEESPIGLHFGERYLDTTTGRWTQQDPLNQASDLREANRYVYAAGDPVNATDPSGRDVVDWFQEKAADVDRWVYDTKQFLRSGAGRCVIGAVGGGVIGGAVGSIASPAGSAIGARAGSIAGSALLGAGAGCALSRWGRVP